MGNHVWNNKKHEIMLKTSLQNEKWKYVFWDFWRKVWKFFWDFVEKNVNCFYIFQNCQETKIDSKK